MVHMRYENAAFSDIKKTDNAEKSNSTNTGSGSYSYNRGWYNGHKLLDKSEFEGVM